MSGLPDPELLERVTAMMNDPDLTGDTLLLSLAINHVYYERKATGRRARLTEGTSWKQSLEVAGFQYAGGWKARAAIVADLPRYEPRTQHPVCSGPMVKRAGLCGKPATYQTIKLYDPVTGAWDTVGGCSRHWPVIDGQCRAARKEWQTNGSPTPPNNTGGVLYRYWADDTVDGFYKWARPGYKTDTDIPEPKAPRPVFSIIKGGKL